MENEKKINVQLCGGKSIFSKHEEPLIAYTTYCSHSDNCELYKNGYCINAVAPLSNSCCYGRQENKKGYTSKAQKYRQFKDEYEKDPMYKKAEYPYNTVLCVVDDMVYLDLSYVDIKYNDEQGQYSVNHAPAFSHGCSFVPLKSFAFGLIKEIYDANPHTIFDNRPIEAYHEKIIPKMLLDMKTYLPSMYKAFIKEHDIPRISCIGQTALLSTMARDIDIMINKREWHWNGTVLTIDDPSLSFVLPLGWEYETANITVKPKGDCWIKVTDDNQVTPDTVYKM